MLSFWNMKTFLVLGLINRTLTFALKIIAVFSEGFNVKITKLIFVFADFCSDFLKMIRIWLFILWNRILKPPENFTKVRPFLEIQYHRFRPKLLNKTENEKWIRHKIELLLSLFVEQLTNLCKIWRYRGFYSHIFFSKASFQSKICLFRENCYQ